MAIRTRLIPQGSTAAVTKAVGSWLDETTFEFSEAELQKQLLITFTYHSLSSDANRLSEREGSSIKSATDDDSLHAIVF